jgi:hypothetical protein
MHVNTELNESAVHNTSLLMELQAFFYVSK